MATYYSDKLAQHGERPRGVDWNGEESQTLRFEQLCKVIGMPIQFSINDLGCGYGALYDFLAQKYETISYAGCALFDLCKRRYSKNVALLHDYGLYEFTILIRKQP